MNPRERVERGTLVDNLLVLGQLPLALMAFYLDGLAIAAALWSRRPATARPRFRFAVLVPAHNEELTLPGLLATLRDVDYPRDLFVTYVVADNCDDNTAEVARGAGAHVHERHDNSRRGKGYALDWLLEQVRNSGEEYDAFVVVDADCLMSANFLQIMNRHLIRGDKVIQAQYGAANPDEGWSAALRFAGLALVNNLRPRGRDAAGLFVGLKGTGMCFRADILERRGWDSYSLAEDRELHARLAEEGVRVRFAPDAKVLSDMPTTLRQARSQNLRWERGRLQLLRTYGPRFARLAWAHQRPELLDVLIEQCVPPLSVLLATSIIGLAMTTALRAHRARLLAAAIVAGQAAYVIAGLILVGARMRTYVALLGAPVYIAWKIWIYLLAAAHLNEDRWVRTSRNERPQP